MNTYKALLIDPEKESVTEVQVRKDDISHINELIGSRVFTGAYVPDIGTDALYIDDEGLFEGEDFFRFDGNMDFTFAGRGLLVGSNEEGE